MHLTSNAIAWNYDYCNAITDLDDHSLQRRLLCLYTKLRMDFARDDDDDDDDGMIVSEELCEESTPQRQ